MLSDIFSNYDALTGNPLHARCNCSAGRGVHYDSGGDTGVEEYK